MCSCIVVDLQHGLPSLWAEGLIFLKMIVNVGVLTSDMKKKNVSNFRTETL